MADKPSRSLVLYGGGLARSINPTQTHLHSFASRASCGFLALPHSPASEKEDRRIIREFAELVDANEAYENWDGKRISEDEFQENCGLPNVAERFMGMKAGVITENSSLKSFGSKLGFKVLNESIPSASELLKLLGFQEGKKTSETSEFDLVFVHIEAKDKNNGPKDIEFANCLVGDLLQIADSETEIASRLHLSVIMSYGATLGDDHLELSVYDAKAKNDSELSLVFPRQSYMMKAGKLRENIRQHCPMLLAQYQNGVTRVDMVKSFSFRDFVENGGNLVIPADRFIHEVAFKLWKAPKYGA